jgi:hypothetical protein
MPISNNTYMYTKNLSRKSPFAELEIHTKKGPVLHSTVARSSGVGVGDRSSRLDSAAGADGWYIILQRLKDIQKSLASAHCSLVAGAGYIAVSLILRPLATNVAAAPTLIATLHTREHVRPAIAAVLALWDAQVCVAVRVHVLLENWLAWVFRVAS